MAATPLAAVAPAQAVLRVAGVPVQIGAAQTARRPCLLLRLLAATV